MQYDEINLYPDNVRNLPIYDNFKEVIFNKSGKKWINLISELNKKKNIILNIVILQNILSFKPTIKYNTYQKI